jgi:hypothetical protein
MAFHWQFKGGVPEELDNYFATICMCCMSVGIPDITLKTYKEFTRRVNAMQLVNVSSGGLTEELAIKFIGLTTNCSKLTANQWAVQAFGKRHDKTGGK